MSRRAWKPSGARMAQEQRGLFRPPRPSSTAGRWKMNPWGAGRASEGVLAPPACARAPVIGGRHRHSLPMRPGDNIIPVPTALFMVQVKSECHFSNSTRQVHFLDRSIYNREELVRFDSHVGEDLAVSELGRPAAELWNRQKDALQRARAAVHTFCRINYKFLESSTMRRRGRGGGGGAVTETERHRDRGTESRSGLHKATSGQETYCLPRYSLYIFSPTGAYSDYVSCKDPAPATLKSGASRMARKRRRGVVSTGLIPNGDWTFQTMVMLEIVPQSGEVYTCHVEHPSWTSPVTVEWSEKPSDLENSLPIREETCLPPSLRLLGLPCDIL
uniref:Ig-like domain-containing protein n=1 Tax=Monodon monoceros TaxID=40151 RepID=A0A8C6F8P0_MONMO